MSKIELIMQRDRGALKPADPYSEESMASIPAGTDLLVSVTSPRQLKFTKMVHATLHHVCKNHPDFRTVEDLKMELKIRARMVTPFAGVNPRTGQPMIYWVPESTSFHAMDEVRFRQVWEMWKAIICSDIIPGIGDEALEAEALASLSRSNSSS
jgi:hypothetical protein